MPQFWRSTPSNAWQPLALQAASTSTSYELGHQLVQIIFKERSKQVHAKSRSETGEAIFNLQYFTNMQGESVCVCVCGGGGGEGQPNGHFSAALILNELQIGVTAI